MVFQIQKLVGGLLMPVPVVLALLVLGLALLALRRRYLGGGLLVLGVAVLLAVSTPPLSERALASLEGRYPVLVEPPAAGWIVVLGGGARAEAGWPDATKLSESSLYRLAEGVRLARALPEAMLVTSGDVGGEGEPVAMIMARVARQWGIAPERILAQEGVATTAEEARAIARRLGPDERVILVTSAFHMPRAVALFEGQGVDVVPAPAGHLAEPEQTYRHLGDYLPQAGHIEFMRRVWWEWLGRVWAVVSG